MDFKKLAPSEIRYSQDSISNTFRSGQNIGETLDEIVSDPDTANRIPKISVFNKDDTWFTSDNRRLWVFKKAEEIERQQREGTTNGNRTATERERTTNENRTATEREGTTNGNRTAAEKQKYCNRSDCFLHCNIFRYETSTNGNRTATERDG